MNELFYFLKRLYILSGKILYLNIVGMVLIGIFEGVGIFLLIPLIGLTGIVDVGYDYSSIFWLYSNFKEMPQTLGLIIVLGAYAFLIIAQSYFQRNQSILNAKIQQNFIRHLREETYNSILKANWGFFLKKKKTDLLNLMSLELNRVAGGTTLFLQFISSLIFTFIQLCLAFWLSASMTISLIILGSLLLIFSKTFVKKSKEFGEDTMLLSKEFIGGVTDHFNGIKEIKSNSLEENHINWFHNISGEIEKNILNIVRLKTLSQFVYKIVSALLIVTFVFVAIKVLKTQPAQLMLIIVIFSRLWPRLAGIQSNLEQLSSVLPSFKSFQDLQAECQIAKELEEENYKKIEPISILRGIECKHVSFKYQTQSNYALKKINLYVPTNCMTAIVGPSGAGKSTLIDMIMGLNIPEEGQVLIDGNPLLKDNLLSLRKSISYVPQDPFLFNTSIRENMMIVNPQATEAQMWESLEFAAADFVKNLPKGLDTKIGDRGIRLSGGERQRIVLARAILRNPAVLVLDEATSSLDTENEAKVQQALEQLKGKMTIIVIAHRLSTIRNAEQVIVLEEGRIVQQGNFNELAMDKKNVFGKLLGKQLEVMG
ncbi:ABC transporter ATP-binding protein [Metabacillus litoralis]|uniref:ABC transporter ATP-binding protein n=1 Tax=Metabacillus litoralis TaxID=152268 RepID=A0A5C6W362_9BACI|nr:ABC transporter ATP-binding protein [Metabacillus litoralis]TXC92349.1 ABC transporter ATP-binding protein [Metabacillus litoralis]